MMLQRRKQAATADDGAPRPKTRVQAESAGATKLKSNGKVCGCVCNCFFGVYCLMKTT